MTNLRWATAALVILVGACERVATDQSKPVESTVAAAPSGAPAVEAAPSNPLLTDALDWSATPGSKVDGSGNAGSATLAKNGIVSVVGLNAPVAVGDTVTISGKITGPAGRKVRILAMRHCDAVDEVDATAAIVDLTGTEVPAEVSHTFRKPYGCVRFSLNSSDGEPIDVSIASLEFIRVHGK